ncbi:MAG: carboxypeptidase regulatory-like domain-containing protein [Gemmatimonadales bacterium]
MRALQPVAPAGVAFLLLALGGVFGGAAVTGEVKFVGTPPANPTIDMSEEPQCKAHYPTTPRQPIAVVGSTGSLAGVFVYVKTGLPAAAKYTPPTTPVVLDQKACLYHPRVFGIMVGQPLEIRNSDPLLHNIKATGKENRPFNISQPVAGMTMERTFTTPEVMVPFECNVHGWMHAFAGVLSHPFFATTGPDGRFTINNLPPGTYTIEAWHEKFGRQTATVTLQDDQTGTLNLTYPTKQQAGRASRPSWVITRERLHRALVATLPAGG